ncbi:MAG: pyridoxal phosphate-dependent aminotransferase [Chloroflexi bacterium]|nr:pyridoxal phosphate-dependent aminotransferase [Chloroflexota bacterium]
MMRYIAQRIVGVPPSATLQASAKARQMRQQGIDVIDLGGGDPDFNTPSHIIAAATKAMEEGFTHYVSSRGIKELLDAVSEKFRRDNGLEYDPDKEIVICPSGKFALYAAIMTTINAGDEVLVPEPSWVTYKPCVQLAEGVPVAAALDKQDNFRLTKEKLEAAASPRTRMVIVNSPNNPTGRVLTPDEMNALARFAVERDIWVLSDEIYERIIYDGRRHVSLATLPGMRERTLTLNGFSKTYAMTGWRLGYLAGPAEVINQIAKMQEQSVTCAASFAQRAGVAALLESQDCVAEMVAEYDARRRLMTDGLNRIPGVHCPSIEGAFYAFPDISGTGLDSNAFGDMLLNQAQVSVTAGIAFGDAGEGHIRLSFAVPRDQLEAALERMERALAARVR